MATYTWLNTSGGRDWAVQADWNPAAPVGGPVIGDTIIFDGGETGYTGDLDNSIPTANVPFGGSFDVQITGLYTGGTLDTNIGINDLTINSAATEIFLANTVSGADLTITNGMVRNSAPMVFTNIIISSGGFLVISAPGGGATTCTNSGYLDCSSLFEVTNAFTAEAGSIVELDGGGELDVGSFVTTGASEIVGVLGFITCSGDFNVAENNITWTLTGALELDIDGTSSVFFDGGDSTYLYFVVNDAITMLDKPAIQELSITALSSLDGDSFGINLYGDISAVNTSDWTNTGAVTQKDNGTWTLTDTDIVLDQMDIDAAITLTLAADARCLRAEVPAGAVVTGNTIIFQNPVNDFADLEGTIQSALAVNLNTDVGNSLPLRGPSLIFTSDGSVLTQTGVFNISGSTRIQSGLAGTVGVIRTDGCDLNSLVLGGAGAANLSGKIVLSGTCEIGSIARGHADNLLSGIDFGDSNLYMNGGTLVGTGFVAASNENISGRVYQGVISDLDMSSASPLLAYTSTDSGGNVNVIFSDGAILGLINAADYKIISDYYAGARDKELLANGDLFDAVYHVITLNELAQEVDLLAKYWSTYLITANFVETPSGLMPAVTALNNHVIVRGSYEDINEYFADNLGLLISSTWQTLSSDAGYDISNTYVE